MKQKTLVTIHYVVLATIIILVIVAAAAHEWLTLTLGVVYATSVVSFILLQKDTHDPFVIYLKEIESAGEENPNLSPDHCSDGIRSLAGRTIREPHKCDNCPNETDGCKKLILAGGDHICVV